MGFEMKACDMKRRYRSGCWTCRDKKIRCDERKPACSICRRSQRPCVYGIKLLWQDEADAKGIALGRSGTSRRTKNKRRTGFDIRHLTYDYHFVQASTVENWMFLNTVIGDFEPKARRTFQLQSHEKQLRCQEPPFTTEALTHNWIPLTRASVIETDPLSLASPPQSIVILDDINCSRSSRQYFTHYTTLHPHTVSLPSPPHSPALSNFPSMEGSFLSYFEIQLSEWCKGFGKINPYRSIVLRLAFGTGSTMLLHAILAASANQLRILDDTRFSEVVWIYRGKSLKALQRKIQRCRGLKDWSGWEDILATVIMLCFFDVSDQCTSSWRSHLDFARCLRSLPQLSSQRLSSDQESLLHFFSCYFDSHEVVAGTAADCRVRSTRILWIGPNINMKEINSDAGVSHELLSLISQISSLGIEASEVKHNHLNRPPSEFVLAMTKIQAQRDSIERQLHNLEPKPSHTNPSPTTCSSELATISACKRLSAILYLHFRLDSSHPAQPHIARLTSQILALLPKIGIWSNTILWPLYIVGVMGVQSEHDEDKLLVLERFEKLQQTRQLGNVKRARRVVEAVWRVRDIRGNESVRWDDIQEIVLGDGGELSLM